MWLRWGWRGCLGRRRFCFETGSRRGDECFKVLILGCCLVDNLQWNGFGEMNGLGAGGGGVFRFGPWEGLGTFFACDSTTNRVSR